MTQPADQAHRAAGEVALTEQFDNHDGFRPEASPRLAGAELRLVGEEGALTAAFGADGTLAWQRDGDGDGASGSAPYEAFAIRDDVVAVASRVDERRSAFAVLDLAEGRALAVLTRLEDSADGAVREHTRYVQAAIGERPPRPFPPTGELVGKRVQWRYSDTHVFEHIYLNPTAYCWHGVAGPERWIGDVDPCTTYRLGEELYLFSWSETVVPFNGAVVIDLRAGRSTGRFFGWDTARGEAGQIVVGADGTVLNETAYVGV